jgi:DNA-binding transcriptional MerR regulator
MKRWYVKELAEITNTSVQALHHYDHIGLLKPSGYSSKGYRLYDEADLLKLQQIIALKFFGFALKQIKSLLSGEATIREHFLAQVSFLDKKAQALNEASKALTDIIQKIDDSSKLPWQSIINLIEVYRMEENLEHSWVKKILNPKELKQFVQFETGLKKRFSSTEKSKFHDTWGELVLEIANSLNNDPAKKSSMDLGKRVMDLINNLYGDEHANLRQVIWEKGFKEGHAQEHSMSQEMVTWLDKAIYAYYADRIYTLLKTPKNIDKNWAKLMKEMFAGAKDQELDAVNKLLVSQQVSFEAKDWLKNKYKL